MYFFISKVKISLQMDKFPGNDLAKMPIFSHHDDGRYVGRLVGRFGRIGG